MLLGSEIFFNFPLAGILMLLLIPLLLGELLLTRYRKKQLLAYSSSRVLSQLLVPRSPIVRITKFAGWVFIWIASCLALMEPFGNVRYPLVHNDSKGISSPHEVILLVDTSASMRVPDGSDGQTRLETAKHIMEDILHQLKGETVSLYAFTSELSSVVPPTLDYFFTRFAIKDLQIDQGDVGGTRFASVLTALKKLAFPEPSLKRYTVILLTDGGDTELERLTGTAQEKEKEAILNAISDPERLHLRLLTIGLGSSKAQPIPDVTSDGKPVLSKLEPEILQELAKRERGIFYMAEKWSSWDLSQEIMRKIEETSQLDAQVLKEALKTEASQKEGVIVDSYYQIPLGLALLFYLLNVLLPDVRKRNA